MSQCALQFTLTRSHLPADSWRNYICLYTPLEQSTINHNVHIH